MHGTNVGEREEKKKPKSVCVLLKTFMICVPFEVILCSYYCNFTSLWKQINVLYQMAPDVCDGFCWV
jgi:hypothetical protein